MCRAGTGREYAIIIVPLANPQGKYVAYGPNGTDFYGLRWANQRDALVFRTIINGVLGAYVLKLQGDANGVYSPSGAPTLMGTGINDMYNPAWSPDDSKLVFRFDGLYTHEFATGARTFLASGEFPDWKR
jgi:hypothetical protein